MLMTRFLGENSGKDVWKCNWNILTYLTAQLRKQTLNPELTSQILGLMRDQLLPIAQMLDSNPEKRTDEIVKKTSETSLLKFRRAVYRHMFALTIPREFTYHQY